jgi:tripartite-type tricarboxylate transporter receptor subunit TctC
MHFFKRALALGTMTMLAASFGGPACAQQEKAPEGFPTKRVSVIVGFAAGGFADNVARIIGRKLGDRLGQPVVIQNMGGAGGNIAARHVAMQPADGYVLLLATSSLAINDTLYKKSGFTASGLTPVAIPAEAPELLAANPKSGIKSFADVMQHAKDNKLFMGSSGIGSGSHISAEYFFKVVAKTNVKHIPFPGGNPAMLGLLSGDVNLMASTATAIQPIASGELVGIAVGGAERSKSIPNVPTYAELGFPGFTARSWAGFFAPAGTPEPVLTKLNAEINESLKDPDVIKQFETMGLNTAQRTRPEAVEVFQADVVSWGKMVSGLGLDK